FLLLIEQRRWPLVRVRRHWFGRRVRADRKSTRLNSSHVAISYAVFCLNKYGCKNDMIRRPRNLIVLEERKRKKRRYKELYLFALYRFFKRAGAPRDFLSSLQRDFRA